MNNDHQRPECVHSDGDKALFVFREVIFDGERERVVKHPVASESDTPCFLMFAASFFGSNSADMLTLYAHNAYVSKPPQEINVLQTAVIFHNQIRLQNISQPDVFINVFQLRSYLWVMGKNRNAGDSRAHAPTSFLFFLAVMAVMAVQHLYLIFSCSSWRPWRFNLCIRSFLFSLACLAYPSSAPVKRVLKRRY